MQRSTAIRRFLAASAIYARQVSASVSVTMRHQAGRQAGLTSIAWWSTSTLTSALTSASAVRWFLGGAYASSASTFVASSRNRRPRADDRTRRDLPLRLGDSAIAGAVAHLSPARRDRMSPMTTSLRLRRSRDDGSLLAFVTRTETLVVGVNGTPSPVVFRRAWGLAQSRRQRRWFGSNPTSPDSAPGEIYLSDERYDEGKEEGGEVYNDPTFIDGGSHCGDPTTASATSFAEMLIDEHLHVDLPALRRTLSEVSSIIGYPTYDVSLLLVDDEFMHATNLETRGVDAPTDVLSFCFNVDAFSEPGVLSRPEFDRPEFYNMGDMLIDVGYVARRCEEDRERLSREAVELAEARQGLGVLSSDGRSNVTEGEIVDERKTGYKVEGGGDGGGAEYEKSDNDDDGDTYEFIEIEIDEYDDRGVAYAMLSEYDPEIRIHMLVVHGMLHLVGYDHENDDEYELMVVREDEVLTELKNRLGGDFGVCEARKRKRETKRGRGATEEGKGIHVEEER